MSESDGGGDKSPLRPNTFMTFNVYVDKAMRYLTPEEYMVLSFTCRHILGWKDTYTERKRNISLSAYERGFGTQFGGTGLARPTIIKALAALEEFGFVKRMGSRNSAKGQEWELLDTPDFAALERRERERRLVNKNRTIKARALRGNKATGKSDNTSKPDNTSIVAQYENSDSATILALVLSDLHNETQPSNTTLKEKTPDASASTLPPVDKPKRKPRPKPEKSPEEVARNKAIGAMLLAYHEGHEAVGAPNYEHKTNRKCAAILVDAGVGHEDVKAYILELRSVKEFHRDNGVSWDNIQKHIGTWLKHHSPAVASANGASSNWMREL